MNYGAEPADQIVRYYLEGTEYALKLSGTAAKNFAVFAMAVLKDQKKTHGKTRLVRLLRENKPLKFFTVPADRMYEFSKEANRRGLLFVPIRDKGNPEEIEIAVLAEDAAKVNRIIDKMQLDIVESGTAEMTGLRSAGPQLSDSETGERSKAGPSGANHRPSGLAQQTGGFSIRQAVEEVVQDQQPLETKKIQTEAGPVPFEAGESEDAFRPGFPPAPAQTDGNLSGPPLPSRQPSPAPFAMPADLIRARGEHPSVRMELEDIRALLRSRRSAQPALPRVPTKIQRSAAR